MTGRNGAAAILRQTSLLRSMHHIAAPFPALKRLAALSQTCSVTIKVAEQSGSARPSAFES